jgi:plastocyanin
MRSRILSLVAVLTALVIAAAGCGDDDSDDGNGGGGGEPAASGGGGGGAATIKLSADPGGAPKFDKTSLTANPGQVAIDFDNPSEVPHAVEVEGNGVEEVSETVTGSRAKLTVDLKAGEYEFYCPVGNHEQQGMKGTLTVG